MIPRNWHVSDNRASGFVFAYPEAFSGNVWRPLTWPPVVNVVSLSQDPVRNGCPEIKNTIEQSGNIQGKTTSGLPYFLYQ